MGKARFKCEHLAGPTHGFCTADFRDGISTFSLCPHFNRSYYHCEPKFLRVKAKQ